MRAVVSSITVRSVRHLRRLPVVLLLAACGVGSPAPPEPAHVDPGDRPAHDGAVGLSPWSGRESFEALHEALIDVMAVAGDAARRCDDAAPGSAIPGPSPFDGSEVARWPGLHVARATCWRPLPEAEHASHRGDQFVDLAGPAGAPSSELVALLTYGRTGAVNGGDRACGDLSASSEVCDSFSIAIGDPSRVQFETRLRLRDGGYLQLRVEAVRRH
jgi:hypothetical protein